MLSVKYLLYVALHGDGPTLPISAAILPRSQDECSHNGENEKQKENLDVSAHRSFLRSYSASQSNCFARFPFCDRGIATYGATVVLLFPFPAAQ